MEISALVTDLDGTFWATDMTLHAASINTAESLAKADIPFIIATGRRAQSTLAGMNRLQMSHLPAILMNGALVRDRLDGTSFYRSAIPSLDAERIREIFLAHDLEPLVYIDHPDRDVLAAPNVSAGEGYVQTAPGVRHVDDLGEAMAEADVIGFGAFGYSLEQLSGIQRAILAESLASSFISPSHYEGDQGIMVQGAEVDKATGLDVYCERHNLDRTKLAVVGDGFNDVGMLKTAAIAIVPTNAPPEVRGVADALIAPNEEGGWEQIPAILGL